MTDKEIVENKTRPAAPAPEVQRHRVAIRWSQFSLPVKCLLRDGLSDRSDLLFDYDCGHADDLRRFHAWRWTACGRHAMIQMIESPS
jgi:hypothetical protein